MAINPNDVTTTRVGLLPSEPISQNSFIAHELSDSLKKATVQELANYIASIIDSTTGSGYFPISVTDGQQLPNVPTDRSFFLCGKGTYLNINGFPNVVCVEPINIIVSNGIGWSLGFGIPLEAPSQTQNLQQVLEAGSSGTLPIIITTTRSLGNDISSFHAISTNGKAITAEGSVAFFGIGISAAFYGQSEDGIVFQGHSINKVASFFSISNQTSNISEWAQSGIKAFIRHDGLFNAKKLQIEELPDATNVVAYDKQVVVKADGTFGWEAKADSENLLVNTIKKVNGSGYFPNEDGTVLYHIVRWFTPTGTFSSTGTTVTTTGGQLTASMVGAKIGVGTDKRIITAFLTSNTCTVDSAFSQNYVSQPLANWGVFSKSFENRIDGTVNLINTVGAVRGRVLGDSFSSFEFTSGGGGYGLRDITLDLANISVFRWANSYPYTGTKDVGIGRNLAGVLEINNGTLGTLRDLRLRNIIPTLSFYANDATADADSTLPSGAFYKITGSRQIFQKP